MLRNACCVILIRAEPASVSTSRRDVSRPDTEGIAPSADMSLWLLALAVAARAIPREPEFTVMLNASVAPARLAVSAAFRGEDTDIVGDAERDAFYLSEGRLKNAIAAYTGRRPDRVFVRSPTPWHDLYVTYGWEQVSRTVYARRASARILDSEMVLVANQSYESAGAGPTDAAATVSVVVDDTVTHAWSSQIFFDVRREVQYQLRLEGANPAHGMELVYSRSFGESVARVERMKVEASFSMRWKAPSRRGLSAQLWARRSRVRVRCDYEAKLRGRVAVNFPTKYRDHHFWGILIDELFERIGIRNEFKATELLDVCFYSDFKVTVVDTTTGSVLFDG